MHRNFESGAQVPEIGSRGIEEIHFDLEGSERRERGATLGSIPCHATYTLNIVAPLIGEHQGTELKAPLFDT